MHVYYSLALTVYFYVLITSILKSLVILCNLIGSQLYNLLTNRTITFSSSKSYSFLFCLRIEMSKRFRFCRFNKPATGFIKYWY